MCSPRRYIQKIYRGHRARARVIWKRQREKIEFKNWQEARQLKNAIRVQAIFRGHVGRKFAELLHHTKQALLIQKYTRGYFGRKIASDRKRKYVAAICIQKQQRGYVRRVEYHHYITTFKLQLEPTRAIQRCARTYMAKGVVHRARHRARDRAEQAVIARANEAFCMKRAKIQLLVDSAYHPKGYKHDGVVQDFFKHYAHENKLENAHFIKLFKEAPGILGLKYEDFDTGKMKPFTVTDLDLMFTKKKEKREIK